MRRLITVPIDFKNSINGIVPVDPTLYSRAIQYCADQLSNPPDLKTMAKTWVVVEPGEKQEIIEVHGITGYCMRPDIPFFRATGNNPKRVTHMLHERLNSHFSDSGWRGHDVFLYISNSEKPEQRCGLWQDSLINVGAVPAERYAVTIR